MIRTGDNVEIARMINRLGKEIESIVKDSLELSYFSRGSWQYHDVLQMTAAERHLAADFVNERLTIAGKSMHPVY